VSIKLTALLILLAVVTPVPAAADQYSFSAADQTSFSPDMPQAPLNERVLSVFGDEANPVMLEVTVFTPDAPGPFPLAVFNHGSSGAAMRPADTPRYRATYSADYFLSRGYAVVLPMMRGFADSGGQIKLSGCNYESIGLEDAKDIRAVINYMVRQPYIDGSRIVVGGQSFGGWNALALGTLDVPNVKGLVNFVGGMVSSNCTRPEASLITAAGRFGSRTSVPSIWFYGDNDKVFSPRTWLAMYKHYIATGGHVELVAFGKFMTDSHQLLSFKEGFPIWVPKVDAFLASLDLPSKPIYPQYMPIDIPPPTHYATVDDVNAVPYLKDQGRELYRRFLTKPLPRAIAIAPNSMAASSTGGFDPLTQALKNCGKQAQGCQLYAVDNDVVWVSPTSAPLPTKFAALTDQSAVPYMDARGRDGYQKFLVLKKPRAFVIAPDGAWYFVSGGTDPVAYGMDQCNKRHKSCQPYAVNDDIVWPLQ